VLAGENNAICAKGIILTVLSLVNIARKSLAVLYYPFCAIKCCVTCCLNGRIFRFPAVRLAAPMSTAVRKTVAGMLFPARTS